MFMLGLVFNVLPLDIPAGYSLELQPQMQDGRLPNIFSLPPLIKMNASAVSAVVVHKDNQRAGETYGDEVLIYHGNRLSSIVSRPSDSIISIAPGFAEGGVPLGNRKTYAGAFFANIAVLWLREHTGQTRFLIRLPHNLMQKT